MIEIVDIKQEPHFGEWVPVYSDMWPEDGQYVLVSFENFYMPVIAEWREDDCGGAFYDDDGTDKTIASKGFYVNAWMPLPEPYREDKA